MCKVFYADNINGNPMDHRDYADYEAATEKKFDMPGFDEEYKDVVDYIIRITHRIWEERSVGVIYDTYHNNSMVHGTSTLRNGIQGVIMHTLEDQHSYPDRRAIPQEVVWSDDGNGVYFSSHRIQSTATQTADNAWCKATGRSVTNVNMADCMIKDNRIFEEWLVRDTLAQIRCLGLDAVELAKRLAPKKVDNIATKNGSRESMEGQYYPTKYVAKDDSIGEIMKEMHSLIFGYKYIDRVTKYFTEDCMLYTVGNECLKGHDAIQGSFIGLVTCFASGSHHLERITVNNNPDGTANISVRWVLQGVHEGWGMFGEPSHKLVEIMGISQYHWNGSKIDTAWMIYDVLDVLKQIHAGEYEG